MTADIPTTMQAMLLTGHGDYDRLHLARDVAVPQPEAGDVLIRVAASSVNNTDINTRIGWYAYDEAEQGGWGGTALGFPRIQGADIAGQIVAVGPGVDEGRIGERVIVQPCLVSRARDGVSPWVGSEVNGGFAGYAVAPAADTHAITANLSDIELAALPCAYGTAINMIDQAGIGAGDRVLVTGASGNVGIAAILLSRLRGAEVHAVAAPEKWDALKALGVTACHGRDFAGMPSGNTGFTAIVDLVGGDSWPGILDHLQPHGRLVISGAIGGASATIDLRKLYLNNLTLLGRTEQTRRSFVEMVGHINSGRLKPPVAWVFGLADLAAAQREFLKKTHVGKIVIDVTA